MKTTNFTFLLCLFLLANVTMQAQEQAFNYRRSSLHLILLDKGEFPNKGVVLKSYQEAPFPEKYNDHRVGSNVLNPDLFPVSDEEAMAAGIKKDEQIELMKSYADDASAGIFDEKEPFYPLIIQKYFNKNKLANQLVAKWFNRQPDGSFNMQLVADRGYYNASEMEADLAKGSVRGIRSLADAGEELIANTFVVVTKMQFVENEKVANITLKVALASATQINNPIAQNAAIKAAEEAYERAKEGYSVWATAYLFRLKWNEEVAGTFFRDYWMDPASIDSGKKGAFDLADLFELEYIGSEKATGLVLFSLKEKRTQEQIIKLATIRTVDAVYAKLQKVYDVFKPKTPLISVEPLTAKIGLKEGLEGGEKFEVLEQQVDEKTNLTKYVKKGTITVDKEKIWDNRYNAGEDPGDGNASLGATHFKGKGKNLYPGMLLRQLK